MTWQEIAIIAGITSTAVSSGTTLLLKYIFQKNINNHVECLKLELHKDAINAQILINEKHKIMPKLWQLIMIADGAIQSLQGCRISLTYEEFGEQDFEELFEQRNVAHGKRQEIFNIMHSDKKRGIEEWNRYDRILRVSDASGAFHNAKNELLLKELYLSEDVATKAHMIVKTLGELLVQYQFDDIPSDRVDHKKIIALKEQITDQIGKLKETMKVELVAQVQSTQ